MRVRETEAVLGLGPLHLVAEGSPDSGHGEAHFRAGRGGKSC